MDIALQKIVVIFGSFLISIVLTWVVLKNSRVLNLIQLPNSRSSHTSPTPSGGGIAVAVASLMAAIMLHPSDGFASLTMVVCAGATLLGFLDDRFDLPSRLRFGFHVIFSGALVLFLSVPALNEMAWSLPPIAFTALLVVAGVWWINLFNFMDGIDGLAGSQSVFMLVAGLSLSVSGLGGEIGWIGWWSLAICASTLGFLLLNWPPAKIFMGDAGSNFLAVAIFAIFLWLETQALVSLPSLLLIAGLFVSDATVTLLKRMAARQIWWTAHREHAYQRFSRAWGRHLPVTLMYLAINAGWLYPCAYFAARMPDMAWLLVMVGYVPVIILVALPSNATSRPSV